MESDLLGQISNLVSDPVYLLKDLDLYKPCFLIVIRRKVVINCQIVRLKENASNRKWIKHG